MVDESVKSFSNFFKGFKTYDSLKISMKSKFKPLRFIKPMKTDFSSSKSVSSKKKGESEKP